MSFLVFPKTLKRYVRFGTVGASGVVVDMGILFLLADPKMLGLNLSLSKAFAAEVAIINNFAWNELWTFGDISATQGNFRSRLGRFAKFNLICLTGISLSILLLNIQVRFLGMNVYLANLVAIVLVSFWNFGLTLKFGWKSPVANRNAQVAAPPHSTAGLTRNQKFNKETVKPGFFPENSWVPGFLMKTPPIGCHESTLLPYHGKVW